MLVHIGFFSDFFEAIFNKLEEECGKNVFLREISRWNIDNLLVIEFPFGIGCLFTFSVLMFMLPL